MTSNLGSDVIQQMYDTESAGSDSASHYEQMKTAIHEIIGSHFRPEFINRIDETVVFHPLKKVQIKRIAKLQIEMLLARLKERDIDIELSDEAMDAIAEAGYDPVFGARPLKRAIQQRLENPLAQAILAGKYQAGDTIKVSWHDGQVALS